MTKSELWMGTGFPSFLDPVLQSLQSIELPMKRYPWRSAPQKLFDHLAARGISTPSPPIEKSRQSAFVAPKRQRTNFKSFQVVSLQVNRPEGVYRVGPVSATLLTRAADGPSNSVKWRVWRLEWRVESDWEVLFCLFYPQISVIHPGDDRDNDHH